MLKYIFENSGAMMWTGFIWRRTGFIWRRMHCIYGFVWKQ